MGKVGADESGNAGNEIDGHDERGYHAVGQLLASGCLLRPLLINQRPQAKTLSFAHVASFAVRIFSQRAPFLSSPSLLRILRTFLGEIRRREATRAIFCFSSFQTRGIMISANCSVICWKVLPSVLPCDQARSWTSMPPRDSTISRRCCSSSHWSS